MPRPSHYWRLHIGPGTNGTLGIAQRELQVRGEKVWVSPIALRHDAVCIACQAYLLSRKHDRIFLLGHILTVDYHGTGIATL